MFTGFKTVRILLIFATTFSFALTGFTLYKFDRNGVAVEPIRCATVNMIPDHSILPMPANVALGEIVFNGNCKVCHRMDAKMIGPGIKNVWSRVPDSAWLRNWISNSSKLI